MYAVEFSQTAEKQLYKLNKDIQNRIIAALERIKVRPFSFVKHMVGGKYYKLRIGDYRIILDIRQDKLLIFVIELGHRRNIYA